MAKSKTAAKPEPEPERPAGPPATASPVRSPAVERALIDGTTVPRSAR